MATIDSKKLLPLSKESSAIEKPKFLVPVKSISIKKITGSDLKPVDKTGTDEPGSLVVVKKKIVSLSKIINNNLLLDQKEVSTKRKEEEKSKREKKEKDLEQKVKKNNIKPDLIGSIPGQSIFDKINRFIGFTLLGYLFNQYGKLLPKLMEFGKVLEPVGKFVEGFAKNILKGVVDFVEFGYKVYDQTRDFVKQIGGKGAEKTFDDFSKNLNLLLNGAIGAAMLIVSTSSGKPGRPGAPGKMPGANPSTLPKNAKLSSYLGRDPQTKLIERKYGNDAARMYEARKSQGASVSRARADVIKRFEKFEGPQRGLAGGTGRGGVFSRGLGKTANRSALKVLGKTGTRIAKGAFGRVPIVGGLIDFAFSLAMGENPGRAAAKAVGATVGSALGTFIPVPFAGTILGGILGDIVGGSMYDTLVGSKQKPQAKAQGGTVTGGKQSSSGPTRKLKTKPRKTVPRIQSQKTDPGKNIGGKLKIEQLYGKDEPGNRSALRALKKSSEDVKRMKSLNGLSGAMFGAGIDMALGQKPDKKLATSLGGMFGSVIQTAIDAEMNNSFNDITRTLAMANGGVVPSREIGRGLSIGEKIGKFISNALAVSIEGSASKILQNLNRELNLKGGPAGSSDAPGGGGGGGEDSDVSGMTSLTGIHKQAADIIASHESDTVGGYNAMNQGAPGERDAKGQLGRSGPSMGIIGKNLVDMTIGEIKNHQRRSRLNSDGFIHAAGRYQFIGNTLPSAASLAGLSNSDKFSPLNQDKMFVATLRNSGWKPWDPAVGGGPPYTAEQIRILEQASKTPVSSTTFSGTTTGGVGGLTKGAGTFIQGNTGESRGDHFHIGPDEYRLGGKQTSQGLKDARVAAFKVAKALMAKGITFYFSNYTGLRTPWFRGKGDKKTDQELRNAILAEQNGHRNRPGGGSWGGIDIATSYGTRLPVGVGRVADKGDGFGYAATITGTKGFVGHGAEGSRETKPNELVTISPPPAPSSTSRGSGRPSLDLPGLGLKRNPRTGIWEKASLAPTQSSAVATLNRSGALNTSTDGLIIKETHFVFQKEIQTAIA